MPSNTSVKKPREEWCDVIRGICAISVIAAHIPGMPDCVSMYFLPFTLPCFFILSGYFTKNYGGSLPDFFYNKVLKEILLKLLFVFCLLTFSLKTIAGLLLHPATIPEWLFDVIWTFLFKQEGLFFSILAVSSVYFIAINKICRDKPIPMILAGIALAAVGYAVTRGRFIHLWCWDTALVCVVFYIIGYCLRQTGIISKFTFGAKHILISGGVFFALVTVFALTLGVKSPRIIVGNNTFLSPLVSVPLFVTGNFFMISLGNVIPKKNRPVKLLMYIGEHSMLYFMIGGLILAYVNYLHTVTYEATGWLILGSKWYTVPVSLVATAALTLIPAKFSDRFCSLLNGRIRLPKDFHKIHPKTCIAVFAAVALTGAGIADACLTGAIIPNRVYARHYSVQGVDVSSYQGNIDWKQLEAQDVKFAFIKATEGSGYQDRCFADNWRNVSDTDIAAGAYHFFSFESSGKTQAENFIRTVPVSEKALPPVVDVEYYGDHEKNPLPPEIVVPELQALLDELEKHYGKRPVIYADESIFLQYLHHHFDGYDVWLRSVITSPPEGNWRFWQYTSRERLTGYDGEEQFIDMNAFLGTEEEWKSYMSGQ